MLRFPVGTSNNRVAQRGTLKAGVASRAQANTAGLSAAGTFTGSEARSRHTSAVPLSSIEVAFSNVYNATGTETDGVDPYTVRCAVEYPAGVYTPCFTAAGSRDATVSPGATVALSAAVSIPANTAFYVRNLTTVADNTKRFPIFGPANTTIGEGGLSTATPVDHTTSAGMTTSNGYANTPTSIRSVGLDPRALVIAGVGDSIMAGRTDTDINTGWFAQAFDGQAAYQRVSQPGEKAQLFAAQATSYRRVPLILGCNVMICSMGVNDYASRSLAQIQGDLQTIWALGAQLGMKVFQTTITPKTTSTDAWATTVNQTVIAQESVRTGLNDWIRSKPSGLTGFIELADVAETSRNSGIWLAASTADGIHPSATMHTLLAAAASSSLPALRAAALSQ